MKRIISIMLTAALVLGATLFPVKVSAAGQNSRAGIVATRNDRLNVRAEAGTNARIVTTLAKGSYITLISRTGSWWRVEYGRGQYGYCHADYIKEISSTVATVKTQYDPLNVRSGGGTSYAWIGSIPKGETVIVLSDNGGWSHVLYHGARTGYVSSQYLQTAGATVSLNVPSFKQTDARWANVMIGSSGQSMAKIGCATTAIAMMESYRTGTTIYPDAMAQKLRYTASGAVYWPTHFNTVTSSANYLSAFRSLLMQGKPVLFGVKNSYGSQHWVVITGFAGGDLSPANFIINDPGSNSRVTLQQLLNAYPTFYKYFHY